MRWSDFPTCGEKRLICAVIAQAAADHQFYKRDFLAVANGDGFWGGDAREVLPDNFT